MSEVTCTSYRVTGLDCPDCAATVDKSVSHVEGVVSARLSFATGMLTVEWRSDRDPRLEVEHTVRSMGYGIQTSDAERKRGLTPGDKRLETATGACGALLLLGWLAGALADHLPVHAPEALFILAAVLGGATTARRAVVAIRARAVDMNVLMSIAVIGALAIGEFSEAAMVVFLYSIGMALEARALVHTRRSIQDLMELAPAVVRVQREGMEIETAVEQVEVGEHVVVRPGERVALDGRVTSGESTVDESPISGESVLQIKRPGDNVFAGSLNTSDLLVVEVEAPASDSTLAHIVYLVEEAQARQAPVQGLVDRFTRWYTPVVVALAIAIAFGPPLLGLTLGSDFGAMHEWVYRGLVVLVISCPCALVISTPVAIVSAISRASRMGLLVKGGVVLEQAARIRVIAFDKTGTLTFGKPEVAAVAPLGDLGKERLLAVASALEAGSTHPIARAVVKAAGHRHEDVRVESLRDEAGRGVRGVIQDVEYVVGNVDAVHDFDVPYHEFAETVEHMEADGLTTVIVGRRGAALGVIGVADQVRPESARAIEDLEDAGIRHAVMLTGDNERTAEAIAALAGVDEVRARLMPGEKASFVEELRERHGPVAMVGDGINDAPALAVADIGIAMGAVGSDTALEAADVALMRDDLSVLPAFFRLGRRTVANIAQNVAVSITVKVAVLLLAAMGIATLWMAVFADTGVSLLVILNGLRLLRTE